MQRSIRIFIYIFYYAKIMMNIWITLRANVARKFVKIRAAVIGRFRALKVTNGWKHRENTISQKGRQAYV